MRLNCELKKRITDNYSEMIKNTDISILWRFINDNIFFVDLTEKVIIFSIHFKKFYVYIGLFRRISNRNDNL